MNKYTEEMENVIDVLKRNLRPAKNLEPFEDKRLIEGFKKIQEAAKQGWLKKYTLETLFKFIV